MVSVEKMKVGWGVRASKQVVITVPGTRVKPPSSSWKAFCLPASTMNPYSLAFLLQTGKLRAGVEKDLLRVAEHIGSRAGSHSWAP